MNMNRSVVGVPSAAILRPPVEVCALPVDLICLQSPSVQRLLAERNASTGYAGLAARLGERGLVAVQEMAASAVFDELHWDQNRAVGGSSEQSP